MDAKVLRHFTETNGIKLTIVFCICMKTPLSSVSPLSQTMLQNALCMSIGFQLKRGGRGGYLSLGERGEVWLFACVSTTFVHDCSFNRKMGHLDSVRLLD